MNFIGVTLFNTFKSYEIRFIIISFLHMISLNFKKLTTLPKVTQKIVLPNSHSRVLS